MEGVRAAALVHGEARAVYAYNEHGTMRRKVTHVKLSDAGVEHPAIVFDIGCIPHTRDVQRVFDLYDGNLEIISVDIVDDSWVNVILRDAFDDIDAVRLETWQVVALFRLYGVELPDPMTDTGKYASLWPAAKG